MPSPFDNPGKISLIAATVLGAATLVYLFRIHNQNAKGRLLASSSSASDTDPPLLKKHSLYCSYHVPNTGYTYPSIRTFYKPHSQADKLPSKPLPLPLIVFIHGLGGSAAQFALVLTSIVNAGPCLAIDLPGCGLSAFEPRDWHAYTANALAHLVATVIEKHRDVENNQGIVFIAHSMGCSLAALLSSPRSRGFEHISTHVIGFVALCPRITPLSEKQVEGVRRLVSIPSPIFNLWRMWDRRGGPNSVSVARYAGTNADPRTRDLQLQFNIQSQTDVWKRMLVGMVPTTEESDSEARNAPAGPSTWAALDMPIFLIAGGKDTITPPEEVEKIVEILRLEWQDKAGSPSDDLTSESIERAVTNTKTSVLKPHRVVKTRILPSATHALPFATDASRIVSGLVEEFLAERVDKRLSLGWQLQYLSTEGKWEVKNLAKWQKIENVSAPVGDVFRAMKTMREVDQWHSPKAFVRHWKDQIFAVVDISNAAPVYDPSTLIKSGIEYHKFPTVSKLPPTEHEVESFIALIDMVRAKQSRLDADQPSQSPRPLIAVHCHYGFNRTGFFVVCYLVEREGWTLRAALEEFADKRRPGIKHEYFIDTLYARYSGVARRGSVNV